jgi:hypothetical protein
VNCASIKKQTHRSLKKKTRKKKRISRRVSNKRLKGGVQSESSAVKIRQMLEIIHETYLAEDAKGRRPNTQYQTLSTEAIYEGSLTFGYKDIKYIIFVIENPGSEQPVAIISHSLYRLGQEKYTGTENAASEPAEPGDGALFVASVVLYMNKRYPSISHWEGGHSDWWVRPENICCNDRCEDGVSWNNACINNSKRMSKLRFEIDNEKFKLWSKELLKKYGIVDTDKFINDIIT